MGHCPQVYTGIKDKGAVLGICKRHTLENCDKQENPSGSYSNTLTYLDRIFDTKEECCDYLLDKVFTGFNTDYAARYKEAPKSSAKLTKLRVKLQRMRSDWSYYADEHTPKMTVKKSAYISCKKCGSKLAVQYLSIHQSKCPLCGNTLLSNTVLKRLDKYKEDCKELKKQIRAEEKALSVKSTKLLWAVGTDCHY